MILTISGYPLDAPLHCDVTADTIHGTGYILTQTQADCIVRTWVTAPRALSPTGLADVQRTALYLESGLLDRKSVV